LTRSRAAQAAALTVVGFGIQIGRDMTPAARWNIERADKVLYLAGDAVAVRLIEEVNPTAESLHTLYDSAKLRSDTYREMVERIMSFVRAGNDVCVVSYGHPGLFAYPMHEAIRTARREGFPAQMLPGVSSLDCLIADLGLDPATDGMQIFDASDFLLRRRSSNTATALVLLQIAVTGDPSYQRQYDRDGLAALVALLAERYGARHKVVVYEASPYPMSRPSIQHVTVAGINNAAISAGSTLYVPPKAPPRFDQALWRRLEAARSRKRAAPTRKK
jgi:precorrin-2 methylase